MVKPATISYVWGAMSNAETFKQGADLQMLKHTPATKPTVNEAHRKVVGAEGQGHQGVGKVVPVHHEGAGMPGGSCAAQGQRWQGRWHLPACTG